MCVGRVGNDTTVTECDYIYKLTVYALLLFFSCV